MDQTARASRRNPPRRSRPGRRIRRFGLLLALGLALAPVALADDATTRCGAARVALDARRAQDELRCIAERYTALDEGVSSADAFGAYSACRGAIRTRFTERAARLDARDEERGQCAVAYGYSRGSSIALELERVAGRSIRGTEREATIVRVLGLASKLVQSHYRTEIAQLRKPDDAQRTRRLDSATRRFRVALEKLRDREDRRGIQIEVDRLLAADGLTRALITGVADAAGFRLLKALRDELVAYWPFEADGPTANRAPNADARLDLRLRGNATTAPGFFGDALSTDGDGDYAAVTDPGGLARLAPTGPFTITGWFRARSPGSARSDGILFNKEGEYEMARFADGRLAYALSTQERRWTWIPIADSVPMDEWLFFELSVRQGAVRVSYPVGFFTSVSSTRETFPFVDRFPALNELWLGGRPTVAQWFDGEIDEVSFWNRSLTDDELRELRNSDRGVSLELLYGLE